MHQANFSLGIKYKDQYHEVKIVCNTKCKAHTNMEVKGNLRTGKIETMPLWICIVFFIPE